MPSWLRRAPAALALAAMAVAAVVLAIVWWHCRWRRRAGRGGTHAGACCSEAAGPQGAAAPAPGRAGGPVADGARRRPTMGASEAFEGDIEAAARTVLQEAGGHRAKAKELLRRRMQRQRRAATASSTAARSAYWRQLGALSLLDSTERCAGRLRAGPPSWRPRMPRRRCWRASSTAGRQPRRGRGRVPAPDRARRRRRRRASLRYRGHTMLGDVHRRARGPRRGAGGL